MIIKDHPIIEHNDSFTDYSEKEILYILNSSMIMDAKDEKDTLAKAKGMYMNVIYNKEDKTYYGDIYMEDETYKNFKQVKYDICYSDKTGKIMMIIFYVEKL